MKKVSAVAKETAAGHETLPVSHEESAVVQVKRPSKRMLNKEISIIMLVMAAQTISGMVKMQENALSTELVAESFNFHDRPWLHDKAFSSASFYSSTSSLEELPYMAGSEGISSSGRNSDASGSCEDEEEDERTAAAAEVVAAQVASELSTPRRAYRRFAHDEDVWENIFSFLPWEAALEVRGVSRFHFSKALARVTIARMPQSKTAAVFIPCLEDLDGDEMAVEAELAPRGAGGAGGASDGQRLFLGQLRRTGTVPMVRWLVNTVFNAPPGALVSVENRRNTHTQRGKGCAWPTINDAATVERMLGAHHRLFFDTVDGVEGVWLVPEGHEDALLTEVSLRGDEGGAHAKHMPRGTIVVELPASSASKTKAPAAMESEATVKTDAETAAPVVAVEESDAVTSEAHTPASSAAPPKVESAVEEVAARTSMATTYAMEEEARFAPYRVPGVDFVYPGVYRLNPYTAMVL